jgi:hypothetical protein
VTRRVSLLERAVAASEDRAAERARKRVEAGAAATLAAQNALRHALEDAELELPDMVFDAHTGAHRVELDGIAFAVYVNGGINPDLALVTVDSVDGVSVPYEQRTIQQPGGAEPTVTSLELLGGIIKWARREPVDQPG